MRRRLGALFFLFSFIFLIVLAWEPLQRLHYGVRFESTILKEARHYGVDPYLIAATIYTESGFDRNAQSEVGALGLMQLMPDTAKEMAQDENMENFQVESLFNPEVNIRLGARYLSFLLHRFDETDSALAAYNAGPTLVSSWIEQERGFIFPETRAYVKNIKRHRKLLKKLYPEWTTKVDRDSKMGPGT